MGRRDAHAGDGGFTLIEMVITVAIISIAFVAILGAIGVMITSSAEHRQLTRTEAAARNAAEYVKRSSLAYDCVASYDLSGFAPPSGYSVGDSVKALDNASSASPTYTTDYATPHSCPPSDAGVQLVTVLVCPHGGTCTSASADAQSLKVVKRKAIG
jgi:prepilin-type N-terminal cleavage/methylation domain-containing protein